MSVQVSNKSGTEVCTNIEIIGATINKAIKLAINVIDIRKRLSVFIRHSFHTPQRLCKGTIFSKKKKSHSKREALYKSYNFL
jgi:hypothetical protein